MIDITFNENLRFYRNKLGLKQDDVAGMLGVAKSTYSLYETGKREPDVPKIKQLSKILNVSADELLGLPSLSNNMPEDETTLLDNYRTLNEEGQEKLLDYADDLCQSGKYKKDCANVVDQEKHA